MPSESHHSYTLVRVSSWCLLPSANMKISLAIFVVPGISASIVWRACCNSSAAEFTPKISRLKRFMRASDCKAVINRES